MNTFARKLSAQLAVHGWTQKDAAARLGVSQANISRWLSGGHVPSFDMMVQLAARLNISLDDLAGAPAAPVTRADHGPVAPPPVLDPPLYADLHRRWLKKTGDRPAIELAIRTLWPERARDILAKLNKP